MKAAKEETTGRGKERARRWGRGVLKKVNAWKPPHWVWKLIKNVLAAPCNSFIQEIWHWWPTIGWRGGGGILSAWQTQKGRGMEELTPQNIPLPSHPYAAYIPVSWTRRFFWIENENARARAHSIVFRSGSVYCLKRFLSLVLGGGGGYLG